MKSEVHTNIILPHLKIQIVPTDIVGKNIKYKVMFIADDFSEIIPNLTVVAEKVTVNSKDFHIRGTDEKPQIEKESFKQPKSEEKKVIKDQTKARKKSKLKWAKNKSVMIARFFIIRMNLLSIFRGTILFVGNV